MTEQRSEIAGKRPVVLIVDDDPSVLGALSRLLRVTGFEVRIFERPSALLAAQIPDSGACLILDVNLPEMSGIELAVELRASGHSLPVILITGRTDQRTQNLVEGAPAVAVLIKPFDDRLLLDAISRAIESGPKPNL
jgi:two-component system response regulator FixJ